MRFLILQLLSNILLGKANVIGIPMVCTRETSVNSLALSLSLFHSLALSLFFISFTHLHWLCEMQSRRIAYFKVFHGSKFMHIYISNVYTRMNYGFLKREKKSIWIKKKTPLLQQLWPISNWFLRENVCTFFFLLSARQISHKSIVNGNKNHFV